MAKKHRRLFPMLSSENNTIDCSTGVCHQSCPYNCYQEPDYYALTPQLPPWSFQQPTTAPSPSPSPSPCPMIPAIYPQSQKTPFSLDAVTIISVTGAVFVILLTGFFIVAKFVTERVNRVNHGGYQSDQSHDTEEFQDREQVDHPIWFIRTTGVAICMTPRCSGPVDVNPGGSESRVESDRDGDDEDHNQIENRAELGREIDQPDSKERLSSSYRDSHNTDTNSDVRNEISRATNETHQNSVQIHGDGSENRNETEKNEETRVLRKCTDQNGDNSVDSVSAADHVDYTRKSSDDQSKNSEDHKIQSRSRSKSMDCGESSGVTTEERGKTQPGISSNSSKANESSSMPRLNRNKSWVFPL